MCSRADPFSFFPDWPTCPRFHPVLDCRCPPNTAHLRWNLVLPHHGPPPPSSRPRTPPLELWCVVPGRTPASFPFSITSSASVKGPYCHRATSPSSAPSPLRIEHTQGRPFHPVTSYPLQPPENRFPHRNPRHRQTPLPVRATLQWVLFRFNLPLTSLLGPLHCRTTEKPPPFTRDPQPPRNPTVPPILRASKLLKWAFSCRTLPGVLPWGHSCSRWRPCGTAYTGEAPWTAPPPVPGARWLAQSAPRAHHAVGLARATSAVGWAKASRPTQPFRPSWHSGPLRVTSGRINIAEIDSNF
jgi:hypothetical protein